MSTPIRRRLGSTAREALLTVGAVLGTLCLLSAIAATVFGVRLLVFESGSMSPEIGTGAVAVSVETPAADLTTGDVVSVLDDAGTRITHRVVGVDHASDQSGVVGLTLQGDANAHPDAQPYHVSTVDRVVWHAEGLGYVVAALSSRYAALAAGAVVALLLVMTFGARPPSPSAAEAPEGQAPADRNRRVVTASGAAALVVLSALGVHQVIAGPALVNGTMAGFTDQAVVQAETSTGQVPEPSGKFVCSNGGWFSGYVDVSWPARPDAPAGYRYLVEATTPDGVTTLKTWEVDGTTLPIHRSDFPGSGKYQIRLRGEIDGTGWSSASGPVVKVTAGLLGHELSCG